MAIVPTDRTRTELREMFKRWGVDPGNWDIEWQEELIGTVRRRLPGVTVRYFRQGKWQVVSSMVRKERAVNLREIFLFLNRIRIAERYGVQYQNLSFTKDVAATAPASTERERREDLLDAYDIVGVSPTDPREVIDSVYHAKAKRYHPDTGGPTADPQKFSRLTDAYNLVTQARPAK